MAAIPDDIYRELVEEFGDATDAVVRRALRAELSRHRIGRAIAAGADPAAAVADALARDPDFLTRTDELTRRRQPPGDLPGRLQRYT
jgi:hypothetical protein